jgi:spore maturation protein CgeB
VRIVVFGLSVSSAWGNGHATQWRGILRSLASAGHEVVFYERDTPYYAQHRDLDRGDGYEIVVYPSFGEIGSHARQHVARADAAIVTSYQADARIAAEVALECHGLRAFYDLDAPVTLDLLDRGEEVPWLPSDGLAAFDLVLSFTGGEVLDLLRTRLGARRTEPLYGCVDTTVHRSAASAVTCDFSYLGTYAADRQEGVERLFLDVAERSSDATFVLGGPMYPETMRRPRNVTFRPHVPPGAHALFYGSSRCTLNLTRAPMKKMGFCPSARLFEAAACGAPIVSDTWPGLDVFFDPEREILVGGDTEDVLRALALSDRELGGIAARARARTLAKHTSDARAAELVALLRG